MSRSDLKQKVFRYYDRVADFTSKYYNKLREYISEHPVGSFMTFFGIVVVLLFVIFKLPIGDQIFASAGRSGTSFFASSDSGTDLDTDPDASSTGETGLDILEFGTTETAADPGFITTSSDIVTYNNGVAPTGKTYISNRTALESSPGQASSPLATGDGSSGALVIDGVTASSNTLGGNQIPGGPFCDSENDASCAAATVCLNLDNPYYQFTSVTLQNRGCIAASPAITDGQTVTSAVNWQLGRIIIRATGTVTICATCKIDANGINYDHSVNPPTDNHGGFTGGSGGLTGGANANGPKGGSGGGAGTTENGGGGGGGGYVTAGSNGTAGSGGIAPGSGGGGGGVISPADPNLDVLRLGSGGGQGGGNASLPSGGATGGAGGGAVGIIANSIVVNGVIAAKGGNGGFQSNCLYGGGGGGSGGSMYLRASTVTINSGGSINVSGGIGGIRTGTCGSALPGNGGNGGAGRLVVATSSGSYTNSGSVLPASPVPITRTLADDAGNPSLTNPVFWNPDRVEYLPILQSSTPTGFASKNFSGWTHNKSGNVNYYRVNTETTDPQSTFSGTDVMPLCSANDCGDGSGILTDEYIPTGIYTGSGFEIGDANSSTSWDVLGGVSGSNNASIEAYFSSMRLINRITMSVAVTAVASVIDTVGYCDEAGAHKELATNISMATSDTSVRFYFPAVQARCIYFSATVSGLGQGIRFNTVQGHEALTYDALRVTHRYAQSSLKWVTSPTLTGSPVVPMHSGGDSKSVSVSGQVQYQYGASPTDYSVTSPTINYNMRDPGGGSKKTGTVSLTAGTGAFSSASIVLPHPSEAGKNWSVDFDYCHGSETSGVSASGDCIGTGKGIDIDGFSLTNGGVNANAGQYASIKIDSSGNNKVAYYDSTNGDLRYAECMVNCSDNANWLAATIDGNGAAGKTSNNVGQYASLALDSTGRPRIAYYDLTGQNIRYAFCNSSCTTQSSWTAAEAATSASRNDGQYASIAIDSSDNAAISYYSATATQGLRFAICSSCSSAPVWSAAVTVQSGTQLGQYTSLKFDGLKPRISFYDGTGGNLMYQACEATCTSAASWISGGVIVDGNTDINGGVNLDVGERTSIAMDSSGNPRIAYYSNGDVKYAYCTGDGADSGTVKCSSGMSVAYPNNEWNGVNVDGSSAGVANGATSDVVGQYAISLVLDASNNAIIAYDDFPNQRPRIAKCIVSCTNSADFAKVFLGQLGNTSPHNISIALNGAVPVVAVYNGSDLGIRFCSSGVVCGSSITGASSYSPTFDVKAEISAVTPKSYLNSSPVTSPDCDPPSTNDGASAGPCTGLNKQTNEQTSTTFNRGEYIVGYTTPLNPDDSGSGINANRFSDQSTVIGGPAWSKWLGMKNEPDHPHIGLTNKGNADCGSISSTTNSTVNNNLTIDTVTAGLCNNKNTYYEFSTSDEAAFTNANGTIVEWKWSSLPSVTVGGSVLNGDPGTTQALQVILQDGTRFVEARFSSNNVKLCSSSTCSGILGTSLTAGAHTFRMTLQGSTAQLYIDNSSTASLTFSALTSSFKALWFGDFEAASGNNSTSVWEHFRYYNATSSSDFTSFKTNFSDELALDDYNNTTYTDQWRSFLKIPTNTSTGSKVVRSYINIQGMSTFTTPTGISGDTSHDRDSGIVVTDALGFAFNSCSSTAALEKLDGQCVSNRGETLNYATTIRNGRGEGWGNLTGINSDLLNSGWTNYYSGEIVSGSVLPDTAPTPWTAAGAGTASASSGILELNTTSADKNYTFNTQFANATGSTLEWRMRLDAVSGTNPSVQLSDGARSISWDFTSTGSTCKETDGTPSVAVTTNPTEGFHIYRMTIQSNTLRCYVDGTQVGADQTTLGAGVTTNQVVFGDTGAGTSTSQWDFLRYYDGGVLAGSTDPGASVQTLTSQTSNSSGLINNIFTVPTTATDTLWPTWTERYEAETNPTQGYGWSFNGTDSGTTPTDGKLNISTSTTGQTAYRKTSGSNNTAITAEARVGVTSGGSTSNDSAVLMLDMGTGGKKGTLRLSDSGTNTVIAFEGTTATIPDVSTLNHVYRVTLNGNVGRVFVDGVEKIAVSTLPATSGTRQVLFGDNDATDGNNSNTDWDYVNYLDGSTTAGLNNYMSKVSFLGNNWSTESFADVSSVYLTSTNGTNVDNGVKTCLTTTSGSCTGTAQDATEFNKGETVNIDAFAFNIRRNLLTGTSYGTSVCTTTACGTVENSQTVKISTTTTVGKLCGNNTCTTPTQWAYTTASGNASAHDVIGASKYFRFGQNSNFSQPQNDPNGTTNSTHGRAGKSRTGEWGLSNQAYISTVNTDGVVPDSAVVTKVGGSPVTPKTVNFGEATTIEFYHRGVRSDVTNGSKNHVLTFALTPVLDVRRTSCAGAVERTNLIATNTAGLVAFTYTPTSGTDAIVHDTTGDQKCLDGGSGNADANGNYFDSVANLWGVSDLVRFDADNSVPSNVTDNNVVMTQSVYNFGETVSGTFYTIGARGAVLGFANACSTPGVAPGPTGVSTDKCTIVYRNGTTTLETPLTPFAREFNLTPSAGQVTFNYTATSGTDAIVHDTTGDQKRITWRDTNNNFAGTSDAQFTNKYGISDLLRVDIDSTFGGAGSQDIIQTKCIANSTTATCANEAAEPLDTNDSFNRGENVEFTGFLYGVRSNLRASQASLSVFRQSACGTNLTPTLSTTATTSVGGSLLTNTATQLSYVVPAAEPLTNYWLRVQDTSSNYVQQCDAVSGTRTTEYTVSASMSVSTLTGSIDNQVTYDQTIYNKGEAVNYDFWAYSVRGTKVGRASTGVLLVKTSNTATEFTCPSIQILDTGQAHTTNSTCTIPATGVTVTHDTTGDPHKISYLDTLGNLQVNPTNSYGISDLLKFGTNATYATTNAQDRVTTSCVANGTTATCANEAAETLPRSEALETALSDTFNHGENIQATGYLFNVRSGLRLSAASLTFQSLTAAGADCASATVESTNFTGTVTNGSGIFSVTRVSASGDTNVGKVLKVTDLNNNFVQECNTVSGSITSEWSISTAMSISTSSASSNNQATYDQIKYNLGEAVNYDFWAYSVRGTKVGRATTGVLMVRSATGSSEFTCPSIQILDTGQAHTTNSTCTIPATGVTTTHDTTGDPHKISYQDTLGNLKIDPSNTFGVSNLLFGSSVSGSIDNTLRTDCTGAICPNEGASEETLFNRSEVVTSFFYIYGVRGTGQLLTSRTDAFTLDVLTDTNANEESIAVEDSDGAGQVAWNYTIASTDLADPDTVINTSGAKKRLKVTDTSNNYFDQVDAVSGTINNEWNVSSKVSVDTNNTTPTDGNMNFDRNPPRYNRGETINGNFYYYSVRDTLVARGSMTLELINSADSVVDQTISTTESSSSTGFSDFTFVLTTTNTSHTEGGSLKKIRVREGGNSNVDSGNINLGISDLLKIDSNGSLPIDNRVVTDCVSDSDATCRDEAVGEETAFNHGETLQLTGYLFNASDILKLNETTLTFRQQSGSCASPVETIMGATFDTHSTTGQLLNDGAGDTGGASLYNIGTEADGDKWLEVRDSFGNYVRQCDAVSGAVTNEWSISSTMKISTSSSAVDNNALYCLPSGSGCIATNAMVYNKGETTDYDFYIYSVRNTRVARPAASSLTIRISENTGLTCTAITVVDTYPSTDYGRASTPASTCQITSAVSSSHTTSGSGIGVHKISYQDTLGNAETKPGNTFGVSDLTYVSTSATGLPTNTVTPKVSGSAISPRVTNYGEALTLEYYHRGVRSASANSGLGDANHTLLGTVYDFDRQTIGRDSSGSCGATDRTIADASVTISAAGLASFTYTPTSGTDTATHTTGGNEKCLKGGSTADGDNFGNYFDSIFGSASTWAVSNLFKLDQNGSGAPDNRVVTDCIDNGTTATCQNEAAGEETTFNHGEKIQFTTYLYGVRDNLRLSETSLTLLAKSGATCASPATTETMGASYDTNNSTGQIVNTGAQTTPANYVVASGDANNAKWIDVADTLGNYIRECDAVSGAITSEWTVSTAMSISTVSGSVDNQATYNEIVYNKGENVDYDFYAFSVRNTLVGRVTSTITMLRTASSSGEGSCSAIQILDTGQSHITNSTCQISATVTATHDASGDPHKISYQDVLGNVRVDPTNTYGVSDLFKVDQDGVGSPDNRVVTDCVDNSSIATCQNEAGGEETTFNHGERIQFTGYLFGVRDNLRLSETSLTMLEESGACGAPTQVTMGSSYDTSASTGQLYNSATTNAATYNVGSESDTAKWLRTQDLFGNYLRECDAISGATVAEWTISSTMNISTSSSSIDNQATLDQSVYNLSENLTYTFYTYGARGTKVGRGTLSILLIRSATSTTEQSTCTGSSSTAGLASTTCTIATSGITTTHDTTGDLHKLGFQDKDGAVNLNNQVTATNTWGVSNLLKVDTDNVYGTAGTADKIVTEAASGIAYDIFNRGETITYKYYFYTVRGSLLTSASGITVKVCTASDSACSTPESTGTNRTSSSAGLVSSSYTVATGDAASADLTGVAKRARIEWNNNYLDQRDSISGAISGDWTISSIYILDVWTKKPSPANSTSVGNCSRGSSKDTTFDVTPQSSSNDNVCIWSRIQYVHTGGISGVANLSTSFTFLLTNTTEDTTYTAGASDSTGYTTAHLTNTCTPDCLKENGTRAILSSVSLNGNTGQCGNTDGSGNLVTTSCTFKIEYLNTAKSRQPQPNTLMQTNNSDIFSLTGTDNAAGVSGSKKTRINTEVFTSSGSWTPKPGVTQITVEGWGGGAGGNIALVNGGGGGGGGAYIRCDFTINNTGSEASPAPSFSYIIGAGGSATGGTGGNTTFNSTSLFADGGAPGLAGSATNGQGPGGAGGVVSTSCSTAGNVIAQTFGISRGGGAGGGGTGGTPGTTAVNGGGGGGGGGTTAAGSAGTSAGAAGGGGSQGGGSGGSGAVAATAGCVTTVATGPGGGGGGASTLAAACAGVAGQIIITSFAEANTAGAASVTNATNRRDQNYGSIEGLDVRVDGTVDPGAAIPIEVRMTTNRAVTGSDFDATVGYRIYSCNTTCTSAGNWSAGTDGSGSISIGVGNTDSGFTNLGNTISTQGGGDITLYSVLVWSRDRDTSSCTFAGGPGDTNCMRINVSINKSNLKWITSPVLCGSGGAVDLIGTLCSSKTTYHPSQAGNPTQIRVVGEAGYDYGADCNNYTTGGTCPNSTEVVNVQLCKWLPGSSAYQTFGGTCTVFDSSNVRLTANGTFTATLNLPTATQAGKWKVSVRLVRGTTSTADCIGSSDGGSGLSCTTKDLFFDVPIVIGSIVTQARISDDAANAWESADVDGITSCSSSVFNGGTLLGNTCHGGFNLGVPIRIVITQFNNADQISPDLSGANAPRLFIDRTGDTFCLTTQSDACTGGSGQTSKSVVWDAATQSFTLTTNTYSGATNAHGTFVRFKAGITVAGNSFLNSANAKTETSQGKSVRDAAIDVLSTWNQDLCIKISGSSPCTGSEATQAIVGSESIYVWAQDLNIRRQILGGKSTTAKLVDSEATCRAGVGTGCPPSGDNIWTSKTTSALNGWTPDPATDCNTTTSSNWCFLASSPEGPWTVTVAPFSDAAGNLGVGGLLQTITFSAGSVEKNGTLISSTYNLGASGNINNFYIKGCINKRSVVSTCDTTTSGHSVEMQIATCTASVVGDCDWANATDTSDTNVYFGPDGVANSPSSRYAWTTGQVLSDGFRANDVSYLCNTGSSSSPVFVQACLDKLSGVRFVRYKLFLHSDSLVNGAPKVMDVTFNYSL